MPARTFGSGQFGSWTFGTPTVDSSGLPPAASGATSWDLVQADGGASSMLSVSGGRASPALAPEGGRAGRSGA